MTGNLLDIVAAQPPRETAGGRSSNRFDFQKNWSLCKLISLQTTQEDYLMLLDHHEDVVVFDGEVVPDTVDFYQIKTKSSGNWTVNALSKQDSSGHESSIIRKLYSSYLAFTDSVEVLEFVSNCPLSCFSEGSKKRQTFNTIAFADFAVSEKELIRNAAEDPASLQSDLCGLLKIRFSKTDLTPADHVTMTKGRLVEFFEDNYPAEAVDCSLAYRTIFDEIKRKTNCELPIKSKDELLQYKGIGKSDLNKIIAVLVTKRSKQDIWVDIKDILIGEGLTLLRIKAIRSSWERLIVNEMDASNESHAELRQRVSTVIQQQIEDGFDGTAVELAAIVGDVLDVDSDVVDSDYLVAITVAEVIESEAISEASTESKDQTE